MSHFLADDGYREQASQLAELVYLHRVYRDGRALFPDDSGFALAPDFGEYEECERTRASPVAWLSAAAAGYGPAPGTRTIFTQSIRRRGAWSKKWRHRGSPMA